MIKTIVAISDTHTLHRHVSVPECDLLIHTGDCTSVGELKHLEDFLRWFDSRPAKHKILIAGNHDFCFQDQPDECQKLLKQFDIHYLQDQSLELESIKFYGNPFTGWYKDWAFNAPQDKEAGAVFMTENWKKIPDDIDILLTHGSPFGILDRTSGIFRPSENIGCPYLLNRIDEISKLEKSRLKLCLSGHIHESFGMKQVGKICFVNASTCTYPGMEPINKPVVLDWDEIKSWGQNES